MEEYKPTPEELEAERKHEIYVKIVAATLILLMIMGYLVLLR